MKIVKKIKDGIANINIKILLNTILVLIPALLVFFYGALVTGVNVAKSSEAIEKILPNTLIFNQLERNVTKMQKWITYTCATRAEKGYENGFAEAEKFFDYAEDDIAKLKELSAGNPDELERLNKLDASILNYYKLGDEVAKAYIEGGTYYGNAMLDVFSVVESKLNTNLRESIIRYTNKTVRINQSIENVLNNIQVLFIIMGLLCVVLGVGSYKFMVKRYELRKSNKMLAEAMDSLWGEMQLAKKIQTVLLPEKPRIQGYEITGYMMPADDVGGDYYDIINVEGRDWIVIGDVSGHGVPAGLIMMMVQTSIQTVINQIPDIQPSELLHVVDKVIAENIRRLDDDKYMTISVLACHEGGRFVFSGLHQDILIYRCESHSVEMIETTGMWIGLIGDLQNMNVNDVLFMNSGDVLLLYTDGITEAMDNDRNLYSTERLAEIFRVLAEKGTIDDIKNGILLDLEPYTCRDDVTMVVVKRQ